MLISVLYVGKDAPEDWTRIDKRACMTVLPFQEFKEFVASHSGKIYACPELEGADLAAWEQWRLSHNGRVGQYQNWRNC